MKWLSYVVSFIYWTLRWEKYQTEEEAALGRGKRQRKAVSYREAYAVLPSETLNEVHGQFSFSVYHLITFPNLCKSDSWKA